MPSTARYPAESAMTAAKVEPTTEALPFTAQTQALSLGLISRTA